MANNPYVNKVQLADGTSLIDISDTTATASSIMSGYGAYGADGAWIDGTATGGSSGDGGAVWQDQNGYVHLSDEGDIELQTKTVSPTESAQTVVADAGYYGLDRVNVNAIPSNYVGSGITNRSSSDLTANGATVTAPAGYYASQATKTIASGTAGTPTATKGTVSNHSISVTPKVTNTTGYITGGTKTGTAVSVSASELVSGTLTVDSSGTKDVTNYASASIPSGSAGTPTATKGTVLNHAISITPSVTNTTGFITGSTKTGTAVTVSASELVSGTKSISANGTGIDVTNYASVDVAVPSVSPTLISKSITANGTYNASSDSADGYSSVTVNVSGGGGEPELQKQINFIDYDGTILHSYTSAEWANVSTLPDNPSHTGLTAQGWNWTKAQIDAQLTAAPDGDVWVGQMYITDDGKTRIYIHLEEGRLHPYLGICPKGTVVVDWGDNSATSTLTGTNETVVQYTNHTYSSGGDYVITLTVQSGSFSIYGSTSISNLLKKDTTTTANIHTVYANSIKKIELGAGITRLNTCAFSYCYSLESITIPSGVTTFSGDSTFDYCYSLASVTIPSGVTSLGMTAFRYCYSLARVSLPSSANSFSGYTFRYCHSLTSVTIPSGTTSIPDYMFQQCYSLASVSLPSGVTSIGTYAFQTCNSLATAVIPTGVTSIANYTFTACYSLTNITIPSSVTSIAASAFATCYGMGEYHFKSATPPTLANTNAFNLIPSDCIIYVPSASLSDYQTASNWSTYASYMQGE